MNFRWKTDRGGTYDFGKTVSIKAQEKAGATFKGWVVKDGTLELSEEEASSPELTISMPATDVIPCCCI